MRARIPLASLVLLLVPLAAPAAAPQAPARAPQALAAPPQTEHTRLFTLRSELLSAFWGRDVAIESGVFLPPAWTREAHMPVVYRIHGFGGSHLSAWRSEGELVRQIESGLIPPMIHVFLNAACPLGHHEFADSVNNGPWGRALVEEFLPAVEREFGALGRPEGRFLTGHSSGGWSSLWLQVSYPEVFNGTWSTAPDSVDFRDFTGIDVYRYENAYTDPDGNPIQLVRRNGVFAGTIREFVEDELKRGDYGGQFASFNAVFSPRAEDGRPAKMFDPATGAIDRAVAESWRRYDIVDLLRRDWPRLGPLLGGKLHVYCGTWDTFRLEGACRLLAEELAKLGSDGQVLLVEERDHGSLFAPHPELWPDGMLVRIFQEMGARFDETR